MEYWSSSFIDGDSSSNFISPLYNFDYVSGTMVDGQQGSLHVPLAMVEGGYGEESNNINGQERKKKKMTSEQLRLLERSFQEEIKLDPDRKMKLSKELGLQPRQIAVWFQNRKARWKNKQLEHLYESLRQEFDVVSREKKLLQEELIQLKSIMREWFKHLGESLQRGSRSSVPSQLDPKNVQIVALVQQKLKWLLRFLY